ncbi:MAG: YggT family protein [Actinobacteria bacterium]|nr:YggT family protein [Actinomycetota bacterium]MCL5446382.1 YggT family protein [Actinomycetota bacterium]
MGIKEILVFLVEAYIVVLILRAVLSWFPVHPGSPIGGISRALESITEPVLAPVRRVIPPMSAGGMGIDLSFIIVLLLLQVVAIPIIRAL